MFGIWSGAEFYIPPMPFPPPAPWAGPWPGGSPCKPCLTPLPGTFGSVPPSPTNCSPYHTLCLKGFILACNMYYVCMGAGGGGILPPIGGGGADCARGCLLSVFNFASIYSCNCSYAQHIQCFSMCGWSPPWLFNELTWSIVCNNVSPGVPGPPGPPIPSLP